MPPAWATQAGRRQPAALLLQLSVLQLHCRTQTLRQALPSRLLSDVPALCAAQQAHRMVGHATPGPLVAAPHSPAASQTLLQITVQLLIRSKISWSIRFVHLRTRLHYNPGILPLAQAKEPLLWADEDGGAPLTLDVSVPAPPAQRLSPASNLNLGIKVSDYAERPYIALAIVASGVLPCTFMYPHCSAFWATSPANIKG